MRSTYAVLVLSLSGCWNGADAAHLPCDDPSQCGRGQSCVDGFCDGPPVDTAHSSVTASDSSSGATTSASTSTDASSSDTGESCGAPVTMACEPSMRPATRALAGRELVEPMLGRGIATIAGDFLGDPAIDLAVLSRDNYSVVVLENAGQSWPASPGSYTMTPLTELNDMITADLDGDDAVEFLLLSANAQIEVLSWNGSSFAQQDVLALDGEDLVSFTAADLLGGDARPELVVSGSSAVYLVPNEGGVLLGDQADVVTGMFHQPWDTLVIGEGEALRVLVPESNNASTAGDANQDVHALRIQGGSLVDGSLATNFRNPWAIAQGDFFGDAELEIVVAERRLDGATTPQDSNGTSTTGQLRFFRMQGDVFEELGEPLEVGVGPTALAAADLDCDGKTDLVLGNSGRAGEDDGRAQVLFGSCESSARAEDLLTLDDVGGSGLTSGWRLAVADFDGNGLLEVAIPDIGDLSLGDDEPGQRVVLVGVQEAP